MRIKIDRKARKHLAAEGGLLTLEASAQTGCMVTRDIAARAGKPEHPGDYVEFDAGDIRVFARGTVHGPDGSERLAPSAFPKTVKVGVRDGTLIADAG